MGRVTREWFRYLNNVFQYILRIPLDVCVVFDTTTQTAALINTAYPLSFNSTKYANGIDRDPLNPTRIRATAPGWFTVTAEVQVFKSGASLGTLFLWFGVNGVASPNSACRTAFSGSNAARLITQLWTVELAPGDYFEVFWAVDDTNIRVTQYPASGFAPATPSVRLLVNQISRPR